MAPETQQQAEFPPPEEIENMENIQIPENELRDEIDFDPELDQIVNINEHENINRDIESLMKNPESNYKHPLIEETDEDSDDEPIMPPSILTRSKSRALNKNVRFGN